MFVGTVVATNLLFKNIFVDLYNFKEIKSILFVDIHNFKESNSITDFKISKYLLKKM